MDKYVRKIEEAYSQLEKENNLARVYIKTLEDARTVRINIIERTNDSLKSYRISMSIIVILNFILLLRGLI